MRKSLVLAVGLWIALGCTRKSGEPSEIRLSIPTEQKESALAVPAGYLLKHIIVNVRAAGESVMLYTWDSDCGDNCRLSAPSQIELSFRSGPARTIQYLGVYGPEDDDGMLFYYGETTQDLVPGTQVVSLDVAQFGGASGIEGAVAGQYVTSVTAGKGHGPTGKLSLIFNPPNASAPLLIEESEMFDGWFSAFGLAGVPFQYLLPITQEPMTYLGTPLTFDKVMNDLYANARLNVTSFISPPNYWVDDGNASGLRKSNGGQVILGFFGPAAASLGGKACYDEYLPPNKFFRESTATTQLSFCVDACTSQEVRRVGVSAGAPGSGCTKGTELFKSEVLYTPADLRNGKNDSVPFKGPFQSQYFTGTCGSQTGFSYACYFSNNVNLKWSWVPGVFDGPGAINGATLFYKLYLNHCDHDSACEADFRAKDGDLYRCSEFSSNSALGFTKGPDFGSGNVSHAMVNQNLPTGSHLVALLCPFRGTSTGRQYFGSAIEFHNIYGTP